MGDTEVPAKLARTIRRDEERTAAFLLNTCTVPPSPWPPERRSVSQLPRAVADTCSTRTRGGSSARRLTRTYVARNR